MRNHFIAVIFFVSQILVAQEPFSAYVESTTIQEGDSFTLTLEFQGDPSEKPDLSPLKADFDILSQSMSNESSYVNGVSNKKSKWILECRPKKSQTKIVIPSLRLGAYRSKPIEIVQSAQLDSQSNRRLSLVASTTTDKVYVNGEIILDLELKTTLPLRNGNLGKPEIKDAIIEPLVEDDNRETTENGIRTFIFHRSYAIYPAKPGELLIPSINFDGLVADERTRGWFSQGRRISARSKALSIKVMDIPDNYPKGQPFLPLKSLAIIESFDSDDPKFEVNKATTRRFEIKALGTLSSFLPVIEAPQQSGLKVYTETGLKVHKNTEEGLEASVKFSHVYMPTAPGKIIVPEHTIYWWNTDKDELKTTVIRSFTFEATGMPVERAKPEEKVNTVDKSSSKTDIPIQETNKWWLYSAVVFACLWIATLIAWLRTHSKKNKTTSSEGIHPLKETISDVIKAAHAHDARRVYACLQRLRSTQKTALCESTSLQLSAFINDLEALIYGGNDPERHREVLRKIADYFNNVNLLPHEKNQKLPHLYPS